MTLARSHAAGSKPPASLVDYRVGGHALRVVFADRRLRAALGPALDHLRAPAAGGRLDLFVGVGDATGLDAGGANGIRPRVHAVDGSIRRVAYPATGISGMYDAEGSVAEWWLPDPERIPVKERAGPFRTVLQWWLSGRGLQIVDAGAVGNDHAAVLLVGRGGSGKSVTAIACAAAGLHFLGDDSVLCGGDPPVVYCLYTRATVRVEDAARFGPLPVLRSADDSEKVMLDLRAQVARSRSLRAILVPRLTGRPETRLSPLAAPDTLCALAPSSLFNTPGSGEAALRQLGDLVRGAPGFALDLGTDLQQTTRRIRELLDGSVTDRG